MNQSISGVRAWRYSESFYFTFKYFDQIKSSPTKIRGTPTHELGCTHSQQTALSLALWFTCCTSGGGGLSRFAGNAIKKIRAVRFLGSGGVAVLVDQPKIFDIRLEHYLHARYAEKIAAAEEKYANMLTSNRWETFSVAYAVYAKE